MYCYIKYADTEGTSIKPDVSDVSVAPSTGRVVPLKVKYEKDETCRNQVIMVNPDCYIQILLDYIFDILHLDKHLYKIDLCTEKGEMLKVDRLNPYDSALELLQYKETYIVVIYDVDEVGNYSKLEPLLCPATKQDSELCHKISKNLKPFKNKFSISRSSSVRGDVKPRGHSGVLRK